MHCPGSRAAALEGPVDHMADHPADDDIHNQFTEAETTTPPEVCDIHSKTVVVNQVDYNTVMSLKVEERRGTDFKILN